MNIQETAALLQVAKESMPFPQLKAIHQEALKQLAVIAEGLNAKPEVAPVSRPSLGRKVV